MNELDHYTDEELGRLIKEASRAKKANNRTTIRNRDAIKAFLRLIGLEKIADAIDVGQFVFERIRNILHDIFSNDNQNNSWW